MYDCGGVREAGTIVLASIKVLIEATALEKSYGIFKKSDRCNGHFPANR